MFRLVLCIFFLFSSLFSKEGVSSGLHCFYERMDGNIYRSAANRSEECVFPEMQPSKLPNSRGAA